MFPSSDECVGMYQRVPVSSLCIVAALRAACQEMIRSARRPRQMHDSYHTTVSFISLKQLCSLSVRRCGFVNLSGKSAQNATRSNGVRILGCQVRGYFRRRNCEFLDEQTLSEGTASRIGFFWREHSLLPVPPFMFESETRLAITLSCTWLRARDRTTAPPPARRVARSRRRPRAGN